MKWIRLGMGGAGALIAGAAVMFGVLAVSGSASAAGPGETASRFATLLAQQLGVTTERLQEATTAARDQLLAEKVAAGELTQAQADAIKARTASLGSGGPGGQGHGGHGPGAHARGVKVMVNAVEVTAETTGLTVDAVRAQLQSGQSLAQIAAANGVSRDILKNAIITAQNAAIQTAIANGTLTQAQGAEISANLAEHVDQIIDRVGGEKPSRMLPSGAMPSSTQ